MVKSYQFENQLAVLSQANRPHFATHIYRDRDAKLTFRPIASRKSQVFSFEEGLNFELLFMHISTVYKGLKFMWTREPIRRDFQPLQES